MPAFVCVIRRTISASCRAVVVAGVALSPLVACEPEGGEVREGSVPQSSRIAISADGDTLYVALADRDEVRAVDADSGEVTSIVTVPGHPHRLTLLSDGRVAVSARYAGTVSVVDVDAGRVDGSVVVGSDPFAVVQAGDELVVAVAGEGDLARVSLDSLTLTSRVVLPNDDPRGLAVDGDRVVVSHFNAGRLSVVNLDRGEVTTQIAMRLPSREFFVPKQMDQLTLIPGSGDVAVPHMEVNNDPAQFGSIGSSLSPPPPVVYYNSGPSGFPAVVSAVSRADVDVGLMISDDTSADLFATVEIAGPVNPVMNPLALTMLEGHFVNSPTAVALADEGALEVVVAQNSGNVVIRRSVLGEGQDSIIAIARADVGVDSIVLSPNGARAYVFNPFDQSITTFEVPPGYRDPKSRFGAEAKGNGGNGVRDAPIVVLDVTRHVVAEQALSDEIVRGRRFFHSVGPSLARNGAIACASCHPGGGDDGTTWAFAEGPRQSPPLWGGITDTAPFHWDQAVRDMADISRVTIIGRMGGTGLGRSDMNAVGAFLDAIPAPLPRITAGISTESVARGADLFFAEATGCTTCHSGAAMSDNLAHDVATGVGYVPRETQTVFATPPLKGLAFSGPYMHDGSAQTLRDVVEDYVLTDLMGTGSHLSEADVDDLVAFLETL